MSYITAAQLLATLGVTNPSSQQTTDATAAVNAASAALDNICHRKGTSTRDGFAQDADATQVRYYSPVAWDHLDIDDVVTLTSIVARDDGGNVDTNDGGLNTWTLNTDFTLEPLNAATQGWPYTRLAVNPTGAFTFNQYYPRSVKVTAKFGWPSTPTPIVDACTLLSERVFKMKREAPLGVLAFQDAVVRVASADSNVMILIAPYIRHFAAVA